MKLKQPDLENPLWEFALALYSKPLVEETAIALQNEYGMNVNILIWMCWLEKQGYQIDEEGIEGVERIIQSLHKDFVLPLRALRKNPQLRDQSELTSNLKNAIQQAELAAEQLVMSAIYAYSRRENFQELKKIDGSNVSKYLLHVEPELDAETCAGMFVTAIKSF
ncbi:MAG: TIGR02444 family protein [Cellvibrionaceae bacterium]